MYERDTLSGTKIRERILTGKPWKKLLPPAVVQVLKEIDGAQRLCQIAGTD